MDEDTREDDRAPRRAQVGLLALSGGVLLFQVALTRVFAIMMWHHFAYLIVSLALLGFGISGSLLALWRSRSGARLRGAWVFALLSGLGLAASWPALCALHIDSLELWREPRNLLQLVLAFGIVALPFGLAGAAIGVVLFSRPRHIAALYRADLLGSGLGAACAPWLLAAAPLEVVVGTASLAACLAAWFLAPARAAKRGLALLGVIAALGFSGMAGFGALPPLPFAPNKQVAHGFPGGRPERILPSAVARVEVSAPLLNPMAIGGQFGDVDEQFARMRGVTQDGTAPTVLYENASQLELFPSLDDTNAAAAYHLRRARKAGPPARVCVIGVGGGADVMVALHQGAESVVGVEINGAMIRMVKDDYADFIGRLFDDPRVSLVHSDGRSFLHRSKERFDVIQLSGVDTFTALSTGAYTLSESYLYTVEAIDEFYERLAPGGVIHFSRFLFEPPRGPRETIRLANVAREALARRGIAEPWRHLLVLQAHGWASTLITKEPIGAKEAAALEAFAERERFMGLVFDPSRERGAEPRKGRFSRIHYEVAARVALRRIAAELPEKLRATATHDLVAAALGKVYAARDRGAEDEAKRRLTEILAGVPEGTRKSAALHIEAGWEEGLKIWDRRRAAFGEMQRDFELLLRGSDAERQRFVEGFVYDLRPVTDDRPFFFNYFRFSQLWGAPWSNASWDGASEYHPPVPVGQMVLWSSLILIAGLGGAFILLPLRRLERGERSWERARVFLYFAALGLAYIFVEISLMQQLILFLGHPTLSLSVVLGGLLVFSGLGAGCASFRAVPPRAVYPILGLLLAGALVAMARWLPQLLEGFIGSGTPLRVLVALGAIAPLGFLMGMPFPLGIQGLAGRPKLLPWAWGINGLFSVFASMLATIVAMEGAGFSGVLLIAAGTYGLALPLLPRSAR